MMRIPTLCYFGGKFYLAKELIKRFPRHECYIEPFGGAAHVLMQKPRFSSARYQEIYNDIDGEVVNFL